MTNVIIESLKDLNWIWITSDCPTKDKNNAEYRNTIANSAKVNRGTFADYEDFSKFFEQLGLSNKRIKLSELVAFKNLSSAKLFSLTNEETTRRIDTYTDISILKIL